MPRSALSRVWALCFDSDLFTYISHVQFVALQNYRRLLFPTLSYWLVFDLHPPPDCPLHFADFVVA